MYNCKMLDEILCNVEKIIVTTYMDDKQESVYEVSTEEAAMKIAGILVRKYLGGKVLVRMSYDHHLGCKIVKSASYKNGFRESFEYIY